MNFQLTRFDGGLHIIPAAPYLLDFLAYSHRGFKTVNYRRVNSFEKKLLHRVSDDGGIITFQGFFEKVCQLVHKHHDTYTVNDMRTELPAIDWERVRQIGLWEYQINDVVEYLGKAQVNSGVVNAAGG